MTTSALMVLGVVIPASAASLLVLLLDVRRNRRRPPERRLPSRIAAVLGAALGVAGFCLASLAGAAGHGQVAAASGLSSDESIWVVTAGADPGTGTLGSVVSGSATNPVSLPYAPFTLYGTGVDQSGTYTLVAQLPDGSSVTLLPGTWPTGGRETRPLALLDPAAIVAAAQAQGILPENGGVLPLELVTADPRVRLHLTLPGRAPVTVTLPTQLTPQPPVTGATASAVKPAAGAAGAASGAAAKSPAIGVPSTGGGAVLAGMALLLAGGGCAMVSLRLRRTH